MGVFSRVEVSFFFLLFGVSPTFSYFRVKFLLFSRATSPEQSDLSSHYGVCMYGCSLVEIFFTKGIFFYTRFGLIHVQAGKKFPQGTSPPPHPLPVKGKFFDTRFGLIHVQTGKKIFLAKFFFAKFFLHPFHRIS